MLYMLVATSSSANSVQLNRRAALLSSSMPPPPPHALNRRAVLCSTVALAIFQAATSAGAEGDDVLEGIVARARSQELSISKVIDRAKKDALVDISSKSLSCEVLDQLVRVDQGACDSAAASINTLQGELRRNNDDLDEQVKARTSLAKLQSIKARIDKQVGRLVAIEEQKGCIDAVATYDSGAVRERAEFGRLSTDRAIQRARSDKLVSVNDAKLGCSALNALREVDHKALMELESQTRKARAASVGANELDSLFAAQQSLRTQLSRADTRLESFCEGVLDLTAGAIW